MTRRAWQQLLLDAHQPRTAAQDSVLRMALGMWAADIHSSATLTERARVAQRLQQTQRFSPKERAWMKERLLTYCKERQPRLVDIMQKQFGDGEEG